MDKVVSGYFKDKGFREIKELYRSFLQENKIDEQTIEANELRIVLFDFFETKEFKKLYFMVTLKACDHLRIPYSEVVLQMTPTPRVFKPGAIGTSFHCDYWYGHGLMANTVWIPLTEVDEGNTFYVCDPLTEDTLYIECEKDLKNIANLDKKLLNQATPVLPDIDESYLFKSTLMHGSPKNNSSATRVSFDFRFGSSQDERSTKDLAGYYHYRDNEFVLLNHEFYNRRILRYVCGGKFKSTFIQHMVIEASARRLGFLLLEQEAEIERYGFPILNEYLTNVMKSKEVHGIVIASMAVVSGIDANEVCKSKLRIWCALENAFLDDILRSGVVDFPVK